ncbi:MAG: hypothetical protein HY695_03640 [Deltaproteobacteria bacterium]|nr:hypothetical protein [Deltaproteobacteria bacterium]
MMLSISLGVLLAGVGLLIDEHSFRRAAREKEREIASLQKELKLAGTRALRPAYDAKIN